MNGKLAAWQPRTGPRFPFVTQCPPIERAWSNAITLWATPPQLAHLVGTSERTIQRAIEQGMPAEPENPRHTRKRWRCHVGLCVEWLHHRQWLQQHEGNVTQHGSAQRGRPATKA